MSDPDPLLALEAENRRLRQEADFLSRKLNERSVTYRERCDELDAAEAKVAVLEAALRRLTTGMQELVDGWRENVKRIDAKVGHNQDKGAFAFDECANMLTALLPSEGSPAPEGP